MISTGVNERDTNKVRLTITAQIPDVRDFAFQDQDEQRETLRSLTEAQRKNIEHPLYLGVTGSFEQVRTIGSFVSDHKMIGGEKVKKVPDDQWDKKPYISGNSSDRDEMSMVVHMATVDDLRRLLQAAKEHGVEFEPGRERTVLDKAGEIIRDLGLSR